MVKQTLILLYGGRSAEREVSVLSAESVMRAVNYDKFSVKTYFITKAGDFIKTQEFTEKPSTDEKLMTNATVDLSQQVKPSDIYEENAVSFLSFMDRWARMALFKAFLKCCAFLMWAAIYCLPVLPWTKSLPNAFWSLLESHRCLM